MIHKHFYSGQGFIVTLLRCIISLGDIYNLKTANKKHLETVFNILGEKPYQGGEHYTNNNTNGVHTIGGGALFRVVQY